MTQANPIPKWSDPLFEGGLLLIDKPEGISSFGVIEKLQNALSRSLGLRRKELPKMGHGGTLDPFATGLLAICIGNGVKLSRYFLESNKTYCGKILFGEATESGDYTNPVTVRTDHLPSDLKQIQNAANQFVGINYQQIPPMHSAIKKDGKRLYELAREGIEVERKPRNCTLHQFTIESYEKPFSDFLVSCSSGTYIRTLVVDLAKKLDSEAHLKSLRRLASGSFHIKNSATLDQWIRIFLDATFSLDSPYFVPFQKMLDSFPSMLCTAAESLAITRGQQEHLIPITHRIGQEFLGKSWNENDVIILRKPNHQYLGVLRFENSKFSLERVLTTEG